MTNPSVRETKRADELKPGDWLAAMQLDGDGDKPSEVLGVHTYTDTDGPAVLLVFQAADGVPRSSDSDADTAFEIATQEELDAGREAAERAQRIADIRAFADRLEQNPWMVLPHSLRAWQQLSAPGDVPDAATGVAMLREVAEKLGVEVDEHLADRTTVEAWLGRVEYDLLVWHKDGRPVEPEFTAADAESIRTAIAGAIREPDADPTGLSYSRADDDPDVEVVPGRTPPHVGGMVDGGRLVDETEEGPYLGCVASLHISTPGESCGVCGAEGMRSALHLEVSATVSDMCSAECACGVEVSGFDGIDEARGALAQHIADAGGDC